MFRKIRSLVLVGLLVLVVAAVAQQQQGRSGDRDREQVAAIAGRDPAAGLAPGSMVAAVVRDSEGARVVVPACAAGRPRVSVPQAIPNGPACVGLDRQRWAGLVATLGEGRAPCLRPTAVQAPGDAPAGHLTLRLVPASGCAKAGG